MLPALAASQSSYQPKSGETVMIVSFGGARNVVIQLNTAKAPKTTQKIIGLVNRNFYTGIRVHKAVRKPRPFLITLGDPKTKTTTNMNDPQIGQGGSGQKINFENTGLKNVKGAVGLSTLPGDKNSGDSQFYILLADQGFLDGSYTVFGKVVEGMNVVESIQLGDQVTSVTIKRG